MPLADHADERIAGFIAARLSTCSKAGRQAQLLGDLCEHGREEVLRSAPQYAEQQQQQGENADLRQARTLDRPATLGPSFALKVWPNTRKPCAQA